MEQIRNANFSASLRDSSKNSKNSLKKPKVSSPSGREPLVSANFRHRIVGRADSARRGKNWNGCYLHDALRGQELLYGLKESCVDKKNKVNSFGIIN